MSSYLLFTFIVFVYSISSSILYFFHIYLIRCPTYPTCVQHTPGGVQRAPGLGYVERLKAFFQTALRPSFSQL